MSTLKNVMANVWQEVGKGKGTKDKEFGDAVGNYTWRYRQVQRYANNFDLPFRKDSFRIAVSRDPVDRFKSACSFLQEKRSYFLSLNRQITAIDSELDLIVKKLYDGNLKDAHFYTQTWFMGNFEDYDMVVDLSEMKTLLQFLKKSCNIETNIENIHLNQTKMKLYDNALTPTIIADIKTLYEKDYINGWGKEDISI
jgi:hypothetical protein